MSATAVIQGEVNSDMAGKFLRLLIENEDNPVYIYFNTDGGDVVQMKEICKLLRAHGNVTIHTFGECCSAGVYILLAAKVRWSTEDCSFLIHYGEEINNSLRDAKKNRVILKWMKGALKQNTIASSRMINNWLSQETYLSAEKALKYKLISEVKELIT